MPTLVSDRLCLQPISMYHSLGMFKLWSNAEVGEFSGPVSDYEGNPISTPVRCVADSDKIIEFWEHAADRGWGFRWAITIRYSGVFAGTVSFNSLGAGSMCALLHLPNDTDSVPPATNPTVRGDT